MRDLLSQADYSLGRLDGAVLTLPNPDLFVFMYVRKEAVLSSQIEGTQSSLQNLLAAIEFARRRIKPEGAKIETPADLLPHVRHYADRKQEHFLCATIIGANEILNVRVVSIG